MTAALIGMIILFGIVAMLMRVPGRVMRVVVPGGGLMMHTHFERPRLLH